MAAATLAVAAGAEHSHGEGLARTMALTSFAIANLVFSFTARDELRSVFSLDTFNDRTFLLTSLLSVGAIVFATELRFFQRFLDTVELTGDQWLICIGAGLTVVVASELWKFMLRRQAREGGGCVTALVTQLRAPAAPFGMIERPRLLEQLERGARRAGDARLRARRQRQDGAVAAGARRCRAPRGLGVARARRRRPRTAVGGRAGGAGRGRRAAGGLRARRAGGARARVAGRVHAAAGERARRAARAGRARARRRARAALARVPGPARRSSSCTRRARCGSCSWRAPTRRSRCTCCACAAAWRRSARPTSRSPRRRPARCCAPTAWTLPERLRARAARAHRGLGGRAAARRAGPAGPRGPGALRGGVRRRRPRRGGLPRGRGARPPAAATAARSCCARRWSTACAAGWRTR